jgi:beta-galactosidase
VALWHDLMRSLKAGQPYAVMEQTPGQLNWMPQNPWIEEMTNAVVIEDGPLQGVYPCALWGEVVRLDGAQVIGVFASDYYASEPALTKHEFGDGKAYYLATHGNEELLTKLANHLCKEIHVLPVLGVLERLEVTQRQRTDGRYVYFLLNHGETAEGVLLPDRVFISLLNGEQQEGRIVVAAHDIVVLLEES